jgi:1-acyl-sn-glycerol-3-phosphate acyltransferase
VKTRTYHVIGVLTTGPVRRLFRFKSKGEEHLPRQGGFVLYPERQLRFMAKAEMYRRPLKWVLEGAGAFPVRRGIGDEEAMRRAVELAQAGEVVAIFPEGTRRNKGVVKRHKAKPRSGAARVALMADVPLVPAAIGGTESLLKLGPLRVAYGPPVELDDLKEMDLRRGSKIATDRLMEAIHSLEKTL